MEMQGRGLGAAVSEALALGRKYSSTQSVRASSLGGWALRAFYRLTPRVWGVVWATALAAPLVLEPFSAAGKVPGGSQSDLVALC